MAKITVAPSALELKVGEEKQLQIQSDHDLYHVICDNRDLVEYNRATREVRGLKPGTGNIRFNIYNQANEIIASDIIRVDVLPDKAGETPIRIMLHSKHNNRLSTIQGVSNEVEDMRYLLPKESGNLLTKSQLEGFTNLLEIPVILSPENLVTDFNGQFKLSACKWKLKSKADILVNTTWEFAKDSEFKEIFRTIVNTNLDKITEISVNMFGISAYVRAKYVTTRGASEWSDPVLVVFKATTPLAEQPDVRDGDATDVAYYGLLDYTKCVNNATPYRGEYETVSKSEVTSTIKKGETISYKNKLYRASRDHKLTDVTPDRELNFTVDSIFNLPNFDALF